MTTTRGAGITAAAGTDLTHPLFAELFTLSKSSLQSREHSEFPRRAFTHCGGFAPAAPHRAWVHVSEPISGLPLSRPVRIIGLPGRYPSNNLIRRSPILRRRGQRTEPFRQGAFQHSLSIGDYSQFPRVIPVLRVGWLRVTEQFGSPTRSERLAWLSRTPIAVVSGGISRNWRDHLDDPAPLFIS